MKTTMILTTDRLYMRPFTTKETDALHYLWTLPDVRKFVWDDEIIPRETTESTIKESLASFDTVGWGLWCLTLKSDPYRIIGFCGLRHQADKKPAELLFGLDGEFWKQGLATEAARKILDYCFRQLDLLEVSCRVDLRNAAAAAVLDRLGMTALQRHQGSRGQAIVEYVVSHKEFHKT